MRLLKIIPFVFVQLMFNSLCAQSDSIHERIFTSFFHDVVSGSVRINRSIYFVFGSASNYLGATDVSEKLYKCNENLEKLDSINIPSAINWNSVNLSHVEAIGDTSLVILLWGDDNSGKEATKVLLLDTNLSIEKDFGLNFSLDTSIVALQDVLVTGNDLVIFGAASVQSGSTYYPYLADFDLITGQIKKQRIFNQFPQAIFSSALKLDSTIVLGNAGPSNQFNFMTLNKDYEIDSVYDFVNTEPAWSPFQNLALYNSSNDSFLSFGRVFGSKLFQAKYDDDFNLVRVDTFSTFSSQTLVNNSTVFKLHPNSFIFLAGQDPLLLEGMLQPGEKRNIVIYNTDSLGNVKWYKELLGKRYYLPTALASTSEGGIFIFSIKYDWDTYPSHKTEVSVIKLDSTGAVENLSLPFYPDFQSSGNDISIYPNPASVNLNIDGLPSNLNILINIFNLSGQKIFSDDLGTNRFVNISMLSTGVYQMEIISKKSCYNQKIVIQ